MGTLADPKALLLLLLPVGLVAFFLLRRRKPQSPNLLPLSGPRDLLQKMARQTRWAFRLMFVLTAIALCLLVWVVARPFTALPQTKKVGEGIDIVLVVDVSESMEADDFQPNRFDVAKAVIRDFIRRRIEDRIGIVIFSGDAVTKVPLTRDYDFLLSQVDDIRLRELKQGTAIGMGLASGIARLKGSEARSKVIILLTDGDSNVGAINPITASQLARQDRIKIYTIGIGKSNRVIVPIYSYDLYGKRTQLVAQVPSYLNPELLKDIAQITNGRAYMARDPGMLARMLQEIDRLEKTKVKVTRWEQREEKFVIPALVATILLLLVYLLSETRFRKAKVAA